MLDDSIPIEQGTDRWFEQRLGKVTASRIADVLMKPSTAGFQNYKAQLICERLTGERSETFTSAAMQHGTETEPQAAAIYQLSTGVAVEEVGFIEHPNIKMSGASPDRLVDGDGLLEIKCPQKTKHIKNLLGEKIDRAYLLQMQWQMACTERDYCDFVSFNPEFPFEMRLSIQTIYRDDAKIAEIEEAVKSFNSIVLNEIDELKSKYEVAA
jgi:putative phage-type endonuclease